MRTTPKIQELLKTHKYCFIEYILENEPAGRKSLYSVLIKGNLAEDVVRKYFENYFGRLGTHVPRGGFYGCKTQPLKVIITRSREILSDMDAEILARYLRVEEV